MPQSATGGETLLQAIAELRVEVDRWVDAELRALAEPNRGPGEVPSRPDAASTITTDPTADPRSRLDALAQHLDRRLKRSRDTNPA
jgi:hypothetical protein